MQFGAFTDIGLRRKINEDSYMVNDDDRFPYAIVADGMGGHEAGEIASQMAVDIIEEYVNKNLDSSLDYVEAGEVLRQAFIAANSAIFSYAQSNYKIMGMGTTTTMALIYAGKVIAAHVGDSRAYLSGEEIHQITRDHSYVQELVSRGEISKEMAKHHPRKNYITRAMGAEDTVKVDITIKPYNGETVVLCSDGLTNYVDDDEILGCINSCAALQDCCQQLTELANSRGGGDNITVVLLRRPEDQ